MTIFKPGCKKGLKEAKSGNRDTREEASAARGMSYQTLTDVGWKLGAWNLGKAATCFLDEGALELGNRDEVRWR